MNNNSLILTTSSHKNGESKVDLLKTRKSAWILRAINHKLRQQMLKFIAEKESITVTEIYGHLRIEQSITSQHLAILRKANFVSTKKIGKFIYYSVNTEKIGKLNSVVNQLLN